MRITNGIMMDKAIRGINTAYRRLALTQEQVATGRGINRPSDDPHGAARAVHIRSVLRGAEQHMRNCDDATARLTAADHILGTVGDILIRIRELVVRAGTGTVTSQEREAIAVEVGQLLEELVFAGNAVHNGRYLFAGHQTMSKPFQVVGQPPMSVIYDGDDGKSYLEVGPGMTVSVNITGREAFMGQVDIFETVIDIREHLLADDLASLSGTDLARLDAAMDNVLRRRAEIGGKVNRLELITNRLHSDTTSLTALLSKTEDIDFAQAVMHLAEQETIYHAALAAASRAVQTGLLNYLK